MKGKHSMKTVLHHILPTELLAAIFKQGAFLKAHRTELPFPLLVASVCRHWRAIALAAPDIWTNLHWYLSLHPFPALWLERSKACLLDITLHLPLLEPDDLDISLLALHAHRWRSLTIATTDLYDLLDLTAPLRDLAAPHLQHLHLSAAEADSADDLPQLRLLAGGTPNLRSLALANTCLQHAPPLDGVRTLDLRGWRPSAPQFRRLAAATALTTLVLRECALIDADVEPYPVIALPALATLAISPARCTLRHGVRSQSMLAYLALPALASLELVHATPAAIAAHFPPPQPPRFPTLRTLRLDALQGPAPHLPAALPSVTHLQLIDTDGRHVLPLLPAHDPGDARWPALHTITLATAPSFKDNLTWLCATVSARAPTAPLAAVRLPRSAPAHPRLFAWLAARVLVDLVHADALLGLVPPDDDDDLVHAEALLGLVPPDDDDEPEDPDSDSSDGHATPTPAVPPAQPVPGTTPVDAPTVCADADINFERDLLNPEELDAGPGRRSPVAQPGAGPAPLASAPAPAPAPVEWFDFGAWFQPDDVLAPLAQALDGHPELFPPVADALPDGGCDLRDFAPWFDPGGLGSVFDAPWPAEESV